MPDYLMLILTLLWAIAALFFLWAIGRTYFFREQLPPVTQCDGAVLPFITLIIPARNEEHNIGICLEHITRLDYPAERLQVVVVNDHSTDATRAVVDGFSKRIAHIELLDASALPEGWMGKAHGCWLGAQQAKGEWLAFIDADTFVQPALLTSCIAYLQQHATDLLSVIPFQIVRSWQERLWLPGVFLGIAASIDFRRVNDPEDRYSLANGQFLLFRREAYEQIGGHHSVRNELSDDLAFAQLAKQQGLRFHCLFGDALVATRMYHNLGEVWRGFSKNLAEIMYATSWWRVVGHALRSAGVGLGFLLLPVVIGLQGWSGAEVGELLLWSNGALTLLLLGMFVAVVHELHIPWRYALGCALGLVLHGVLLVNSYRNKQRGAREWKGRHYSF